MFGPTNFELVVLLTGFRALFALGVIVAPFETFRFVCENFVLWSWSQLAVAPLLVGQAS